MANINKGPEKQKTEKEIFQSFDYQELTSPFDKKFELVDIYLNKGFFENDNLNKWQFDNFLTQIFEEKNILANSLIGTKYKKNKFYLYFDDGTNIKIPYKKLEGFLLKDILKTEKKEDIEKKVNNLNNAIEAIYKDNDGIIFNGEIDNEDIITDDLIEEYNLDKNLQNKNLTQLKELLDIENEKLFNIYDITGETHKKQDLLKKEIIFYTGIGNKYEGGAFYFKMKDKEIRLKVQELGDTMNLEEVFHYVKNINNKIDDNLRRADLVEQVNLKLISAFYDYTFDRLKKENASNKEFIDFIKLITGRGKLEINKGEKYNEKQDFDYENIDVDENFKAQNIANKALIHVMYKEGGLLEEIKDKQEIKLEDEALEGKTPKVILDEAKNLFNKTAGNTDKNYGEIMLQQLGYSNKLNKPYDKLSFEEKINIGALARILKELKKLKPEQLKDKNVLKELGEEMTKNAFDELNENFSDNFNETLFDWDGTSAEDLGLTGTSAEIFELYQDINGNEGLFDWKDTNELGLGAIAMGITLIAGMWILLPLLGAGAAAFTFQAGLLAGAKIGLVSGVSSQIFSHKGYDKYSEGFIDVSSKIAIDVIISALMTATGLQVLKKAGLAFNPDLLFSLKAWNLAGLTDKGFIGAEVLATMKVSSEVDSAIKNYYIEHHTDTGKK